MPGAPKTSPLRLLVRVSSLLAAAALIPAAAAPANCETDPAAAARLFWEAHPRFYVKEDPGLTAVTTPRFYSALQREWACIAKNPGCLGYRPWPHPDEKRFGAYPTFYIPVSRPDLWSVTRPEHVLVTMTYALNDADGRSGPDQFVVLTLMRAPDGRCWLVDDVVTSDHGSLRVRFREPDS